MNPRDKNKKKRKGRWVVFITLWTFLLALTFSFLSEMVVRNLHLLIAYFILIIIVVIGVVFDTIGIAVAASDIKPLNGMAAQKIPGAREAVALHRNAGAVTNFCNDVVGDICGIISGATGAVIAAQFVVKGAVLGILLSSIIAAITVGGKAIGKDIAIKRASDITYKAGKVLNVLYKRTRIRVIGNDKKA